MGIQAFGLDTELGCGFLTWGHQGTLAMVVQLQGQNCKAGLAMLAQGWFHPGLL